jgi:hypothetical protein
MLHEALLASPVRTSLSSGVGPELPAGTL